MDKLPNAEKAVIPAEKLSEYVLNPEHPVGKNKAVLFDMLLGLTAIHADELSTAIRNAVLVNPAQFTREDEYGKRYEVSFDFFRNGRKCVILTAWIIPKNEGIPRLTTCYIKQSK
ncbi:MAG: hypothetical protein JNL02_19710 [Saprospiraceae bacterium]|nr:hypothetical protein [Saprospiraceae bacterium]